MSAGERPVSAPAPKRMVVTNPRVQAARRRPAVRLDLSEPGGVSEIYLRSLVRAQLRLALVVIATLVVGLGSIPLLFTLAPGLADARVVGIRLPWLLLGGVTYVAFAAIGWAYVRAAERNEADFADLLGSE